MVDELRRNRQLELLSSENGEDRAERRRAAACVRACEGIPTELLETGIILRLIAACVHVSDSRVREVLEELVIHRLRRDDAAGEAGRRPSQSERHRAALPGFPRTAGRTP